MHLVAEFLNLLVAHGLSFGLGPHFAPALPLTARRLRCKGARNAREPRDNPLTARPALAVAVPVSFASQAHRRRREREMEEVEGIGAAAIGGNDRAFMVASS